MRSLGRKITELCLPRENEEDEMSFLQQLLWIIYLFCAPFDIQVTQKQKSHWASSGSWGTRFSPVVGVWGWGCHGSLKRRMFQSKFELFWFWTSIGCGWGNLIYSKSAGLDFQGQSKSMVFLQRDWQEAFSRGWRCSSGVELLPNTCEALGSSPITAKKRGAGKAFQSFKIPANMDVQDHWEWPLLLPHLFIFPAQSSMRKWAIALASSSQRPWHSEEAGICARRV